MLHSKWEEQLILGQPVKIDFFYFSPWKIKDILNPEKEFYFLLALLFLKKEQTGLKEEYIEKNSSYSVYDFIRVRATIDEEFQKIFIKMLKAFIPNFDIYFELGTFWVDKQILSSEHWESLKTVCRKEMHEKEPEKEEEYNFADRRAKELFEKLKKAKEQVAEIRKKKKGPGLSFLINRFCAKSPNINLFNVGELTYYQFIEQLQALIVIEEFDINVLAAINGALEKKKKFIHWTEKK